MDQDTKSFLEQLDIKLVGMINAMEKRLEDKIDSFIQQSRDSHQDIDQRHKDFRADVKQLYARVELLDKSQTALDGRVSRIEKDIDDRDDSARFRWETAISVIAVLVASVAVIVGAL